MKWLAVYLALLFLLMAGCAQKDEEKNLEATQESSSIPAFKTAEEMIREADERAKAASEAKAKEQFGEIAGKYVCTFEEMDSQFWPGLELGEDGTAVFHANLLTGMGDLKGTFTWDNDTIKMVVSETSFDGFSGDKVTDLVFDFIDDDILELVYTMPSTSVGMTVSGDQFKKTD